MTTLANSRELRVERSPGLFPGLPVGQSSALPKRGRGATPQTIDEIVLDAPNPAGRKRLTFCYRVLRGWDPVREGQALSLIVYYFQRLAGFCRADDEIVRTFYNALEDFTAEELRWAIDAKVASLTGVDVADARAKLKFRGSVDTFITRAPYWLEQSPQYQARLQTQRSAAAHEQLDALKAVRGGTGVSPVAADFSAMQSRQRARDERTARLAAEREAYWNGLSDVQKSAARTAVKPTFTERCKTWGENPEDSKMDAVLRDMALAWATMKWPPKESPDAVL